MHSFRRSVKATLCSVAGTLVLLALALAVIACTPSERDRHEERTGEVAQSIGAPTIASFTPTAAVQGGTVTITGNELTEATSVSFNGVGATFIVVSNTSITTTVPAGATTGKITVITPYGSKTSTATFKVKPTIAGFSPPSGAMGTIITLNGTAFTGATSVKFGTIVAPFSLISDTELTTTVPAQAPNAKISVVTPGGTATSTTTFVGAGPAITSFSPAAAKQGATVTINGQGLLDPNGVSFGGLPAASITPVSATKVQAVVPAGATTGMLSVTTPLGTGASATDFKVLPSISSISPTNGAPGTTVHVVGTALTGASTVTFGAATGGAVTVQSDTALDAIVPVGASTAKIVVNNPGGSATSSATFTIQSSPAIASFSPAAAVQGATVTITGTGLLGVSSASVNGTPATVTSATATSVKLVIPAGATSGTITVTNAAGSATTPTNLTIKPKIASFTPGAGPTGSLVTVAGGGLTGTTIVKFGTKTASFTVVDDATITATVPNAFTTGKIAVTTPGGSASSATSFAVSTTPAIASINPAAAAVGASVTITGSSFSGATSVQFNGIAASFTVLSATSVTTTVPAGATTGSVTVTSALGTGTSASAFPVLPKLISFNPQGAGPGTYVLLTGTTFGGTTGVTFGSASAYFVQVNASTVYAVVPFIATPQDVSITLTTPAGSSTGATTFSVDPCFGITCTPWNDCLSGGTCNPSTGECEFDVAADGSDCDDGTACTQVDVCQSGECMAGAPVVCDAPEACQGLGSCNDLTGACDYPQLPTLSSCSDGDACNGLETCDDSGGCIASAPPTLDDGDTCTDDACDPAFGATHLMIAGCGILDEHPLDPPPAAFDTVPADIVVGGIEFIDPNNALEGLAVEITTLPGASASVAGGDNAWRFEPSGGLGATVYARFPVRQGSVAPGSTMLLWSRTTTTGPFKIQSIARVLAGGTKAIAALTHFSEQTLAPLSAGPGGATRLERLDDRTHATELSVSSGGTRAFKQLDVYAFPDVYRLFSGVGSFPSERSGRIRQSGAADFVRTTLLGDVMLSNGALFPNALEPSISAIGSEVVFQQGGQIVLAGIGPLSTNSSGAPAAGTSEGAEISASGRFVAFHSDALDLDTVDPGRGIFVRDLLTGSVERIPLDDEAYETLEVASMPHAVSDGGRYVFLQNYAGHYVGSDCESCGNDCGACGGSCDCAVEGYPLDPIDAPGEANGEGSDDDETTCRTYYRFDRNNLVLEEVAHGNWMAPDRGGRTVVFHPCRQVPDDLEHYQGFAEQSDFIGYDPYDYDTTHTWADLSFARLIVRDIRRDATGVLGPTVADLREQSYDGTLSSVNVEYYVSNMNAGSLSGDGNVATYLMNGRGFETPSWREAWASTVPSPTPAPTLTPPPVAYEYDPFSVAYTNMLAETPGDLLVLRQAGEAIAARRTFGAKDGTVEFEGLHAGFYRLEAYYALDADPVIMKYRSSIIIEVKERTPDLEIAGGSICEFAPFEIEYGGFLAKAPGDRVVLAQGNVDLETQVTEGESTGTLSFGSRLDEGSYQLRVEFALPTAPAEWEERETFEIEVGACPAVVADAGNQRLVTCSKPGPSNTWMTASWDPPAISPDAATIVYTYGTPFNPDSQQKVVVLDRRTNQETVLASDVRGFGASPNAQFVAWVFGPDIYIQNMSDGTGTIVPADLVDANEFSVSITLSNDGRWLAYGNTRHYPDYTLSGVALWDLSGASPVKVTGSSGCRPSLSADGRWLTFIDWDFATDPPESGFSQWNAFIVDTNDPTLPDGPTGAPVIKSTYVDLGIWHQAFGNPDQYIEATGIALSPDGAHLAFQSNDAPSYTPIENPQEAPTPGTYGFVYFQERDGNHRRYLAPGRGATSALAITDAQTVFFDGDPNHLAPGLYATTPVGAPLQILGGGVVSRVRPSTGKRRVLALQGRDVHVVPY